MRDLRLAIPAATLWLALVILLPQPGWLAGAALAGWVTTAGLLGLALRDQSRRRRGGGLRATMAGAAGVLAVAALATSTVSLGLTVAAARVEARAPAVVARAAGSDIPTPVRVVTTHTGNAAERSVPARLVQVDGVGVGVAVRLFASWPGRLPPGSALVARATLLPTEPGDSASYLVFVRGEGEWIRPPPSLELAADDLRRGFAALAAEFDGPGARLLPGIAIGDTGAVDESLDAAMKTSSLSHLTAVSGSNCALVLLIAVGAAALAGCGRRGRAVVGTVALLGFVTLVTPGASVMRATVMALLVLLTLTIGRPLRGLPVLSAAVLGLLVGDPWLARDYGFALSVLATGGLLLLAPPLAVRLRRWMPGWLALVLAVPLAAQLACQPVLLMLNPTVATYGVVANILAAPAAPLATIAGMAACLVLPLAPGLAHVLAAVAWVPSSWVAAVAIAAASALGSSLPWLPDLPGALLLAAVTAAVVAVVLAPPGVRWRGPVALLLAGSLVASGAVAVGSGVGQRLSRPADWQYAACDVGQGDAMLVRSAGHTALIDAGPDVAALAHCLDTLGIRRLDLLVLTHFDLDHVGGADAAVGITDRALAGPAVEPDQHALLERLRRSGAHVEAAAEGLSGRLGDLDWRVLWPPDPLRGVEPGNPASVTVLWTPVPGCTGGCLSGLFLGDLGEESQLRMLGANPSLGAVDVVKVSHHGSADQAPRLYERLRARIGLIGVGAGNDYGHPTDALLELLARTGTTAARTDLGGMLLVSGASGDGMRVWAERAGALHGRSP